MPPSWAGILPLPTTAYCSAQQLAQPLGSLSSLQYTGGLSAHFKLQIRGRSEPCFFEKYSYLSPLEKQTALTRRMTALEYSVRILSISPLEQSDSDRTQPGATQPATE